MSTDPKAAPVPPPRHKGMKIFTYPKIIFIWPSLVTALICFVGMIAIGDDHSDPRGSGRPGTSMEVSRTDAKGVTTIRRYETDKDGVTTVKVLTRDAAGKETEKEKTVTNPKRFSSIQNVLGSLFIIVFFLNLLIMAVDFPRFTIIAMVLLAAALTFFLLWLNVWLDVVKPLVHLMESVFAVANASFYGLVALAIAINFGIIWCARYLDYWEILPNEILHNHGPFSDLERFPTMNLKFDKEIPDILEYALLRSGRLVLHVQNERKAIVLDNVLWIDSKEEELKRLMSRMEVRITTDQEAAAEPG